MKVLIDEGEYHPYYSFTNSEYSGASVDIDDVELKEIKDLFSKFHAMQKRLRTLAGEAYKKNIVWRVIR